MKKIEAIVRTSKIQDVYLALEKIGHPGMTVTEAEGHGKQKGITQQFRGKDYKVDFLTKAVLHIVANDQDVDAIVEAICASAHTGQPGDGKIFIYPVENAIRIRTRESGCAAV